MGFASGYLDQAGGCITAPGAQDGAEKDKKDAPPVHPIDPDISQSILALTEGRKLSTKDYQHYQMLAAQWQLARNLKLVQMQMADAELMLAGLYKHYVTQGQPCKECGK